MKNMFLVINKEKVYAYLVSIVTIITLFFMSHLLNTDLSNSETTSTNIEQNVNEQNVNEQNESCNNVSVENNSN